MRLLISILLIAVVAGITSWFFYWWIIAFVAFIVTLAMGLRPAKAFLAGFLGIALLWLVLVLWKDIANEHMLSTRMAGVFGLSSYVLFIIVTVLVGGIVGGLAGWCGGLFRTALQSRKP